MSGFVEFEATCFTEKLAVNRNSHGRWVANVFTLEGKQREYRSIAVIVGEHAQRPEIKSDEKTAVTRLWLGNGAIQVPSTLVPKLQAFLDKHAAGGAA